MKLQYWADEGIKSELLRVRRTEGWNRRESVKRVEEELMKAANWLRKTREG